MTRFLEEPCPVVLYICILYHHRDNHLGCVATHLGCSIFGIILSVERLGLTAVDLEDICADGTCYRSGNLSLRSDRSHTDELRIETLGSH